MSGNSEWGFGSSFGTKSNSAHAADWKDEDGITYTSTTKKTYGYVGGSYYSPSSWWRSKVSEYYSSTPVEKSPKVRLNKALHQLARTVNIVENSLGGSERALSLAWGSSNFNSPDSNTIYLDANVIIDNVDDTTDEARIDALTGKALTLSSMKRTMSLDAYQDAYQDYSDLKSIATPIWQAQELIKAKNAVTKDWSGFSPYFEVYEQTQVIGHYEAMSAYINQNKMTPEVFANAVAWNLMAPNHPLAVEDQYQELLETVVAEASKTVSPALQYQHAKGLSILIKEAFDEMKQEDQPEPENNDEDQENSQDEGGDSGQSGVGESGSETPAFLDQQVFGEKIEQPEEVSINTNLLNLSDDSLKEGNPFNPNDYVNDEEGYRINSISSVAGYRVHAASKSVKDQYKARVRELQTQINAIREAFSFRKSAQKAWLHAREEGELDEGALHKIKDNNPNIWSQRSVTSKPDVAICILVDESGSMAQYDRYQKVRDVAIILTEALKDLSGVHTSVFGHTGQISQGNISYFHMEGDYRVECMHDGFDLAMRELYTSSHNDSYGLMAISPIAENLDGYAIEYTAKRLRQDFPSAKSRIIIHLSDGVPCPTTVDQCRKAVDKSVKSLGVQVYAIGVDNAYTQETGNKLYGHGRNVVIRDVMKSISILKPFLKKALNV